MDFLTKQREQMRRMKEMRARWLEREEATQALVEACKTGDVELARKSIRLSDPRVICDKAMRLAQARGWTEIEKLLWVSVRKKWRRRDNQALAAAYRRGNKERVRELMRAGSPKSFGKRALEIASWAGLSDIVKSLIPVSEPRANDSEALWAAARGGDEWTVDLLLPVSDVDARRIGRGTAAEIARDLRHWRIHEMLKAESLRRQQAPSLLAARMLDAAMPLAAPSMPTQQRSRL